MKVLLSCVSSELRSYRLLLAYHLAAIRGSLCEIKVQEDFRQGGFTLLERFADSVRECDLVIHLVGEACGARPSAEHLRTLIEHLGESAPDPLLEHSYAQWECELAQKFGRHTLVYLAAPEAPRDCGSAISQGNEDARISASTDPESKTVASTTASSPAAGIRPIRSFTIPISDRSARSPISRIAAWILFSKGGSNSFSNCARRWARSSIKATRGTRPAPPRPQRLRFMA